jgi:ATP-dependent DNA helicase RecG
MTRQVFLHEIPVRYVKGVGPARAEQLARLEIASVEDLLLAVPRRYEDRRQVVAIRDLFPGQLATVRGRVTQKRFRPIRGRRPIVEAALDDATGRVACVWFNQPYVAKLMEIGDELILYGKVEWERRPQLINPETERVEADGEEPGLHTGRIVPIYGLTEGLTQRWFRKTTQAALGHAASAPEILPEPLRRRYRLPELAWALRHVHFPDTFETLADAQRRLAFEELFVLQLRLALRRARLTGRFKPQRYTIQGPLLEGLLARLPFRLTGSQQRVLDELLADLARPSPMLRLIQGDVGCGKTILAIALIAVAAQSGVQAAFMAPTELLAQQHQRVLRGYLAPLGVRVELLAQGVKPPERARLLRDVAEGRAQVLVGTHALLQESVQFKALGLAVIDEQHKFGVSQRAGLAKKAEAPDVLVMSATPIPRTMALSIYGDLTCSTIDELPAGRSPIRTVWHPEADREQAYAEIRREVAQGRQAYVVYPLVKPDDASELKAATAMARELQQGAFAGLRVGLLHGQMASEEQDRVMEAFLGGRLDVLVSTVIIEVGLDVPNATVMLIEHAERFGLAQLHQLRGRIGRGPHASSCLVISDAQEEAAVKRLEAFVGTTDGFKLAEADLALRGPGELLGSLQHGWMRLRVADLARDQALLETVRQEAFAAVDRDPKLTAPEWAVLRQRLRTPARSG